jgi:hypothetical protein
MSKKLMCLSLAVVVAGLLSPAMGQAPAGVPGRNRVLFEYWFDIGGTAVANLTGNARYPDSPDDSEWRDDFMSRVDWRDNFGTRGRAYLYPPETADYTFWVAGDDECQLWLSTDDDPANAVRIAGVTGWTNAQDWEATDGEPGPNQKSAPIRLEVGKRYYIEGLMKEGGGGDSLGVAWGGPGIGDGPTLLRGTYLSAFIRDPEPLFKARNPNPADGAVGIAAGLFQWEAGGSVRWHDVYFGTDPNPPFVQRTPHAANQPPFHFVPILEPGVQYFWKIDQVEQDGTVHEGPVWSFITQALTAYYPQPADEAWAVSPTTTLRWEPGRDAVIHRLYLSTDLDAVAQGAAEADIGEIDLDENAFTPDEELLGATTYYWRVDVVEHDGTVLPGDIWSLTTFLLIEDFESYTDEEGERIYETWFDGWEIDENGSQVGYDEAPFAERTVVHGGSQSMPLTYDNTTAAYSEAQRAFSPAQDWTVNGVSDLVLYVRGYPAVETFEPVETAGKMDITGAGADIWGTSDQFSYAYKTLTGDGAMVARVLSNGEGTDVWAKGGVMIRDGLNGNSKHAMMVITGGGGNGASFQWRPDTGSESSNADVTGTVEPPYWVKIEREGDMFTGSISSDGQNWSFLGTSMIEMEAPVYIGICVTSHVAGTDRTFEFDSIISTGGVSGEWQGAVISAPRHNDPADFYVTIEDSTGRGALVNDPNVVTTGAWTEVKLPLDGFVGVNLARVNTLSVGVGNPADPVPGTGLIFIDNIRLLTPEPVVEDPQVPGEDPSGDPDENEDEDENGEEDEEEEEEEEEEVELDEEL